MLTSVLLVRDADGSSIIMIISSRLQVFHCTEWRSSSQSVKLMIFRVSSVRKKEHDERDIIIIIISIIIYLMVHIWVQETHKIKSPTKHNSTLTSSDWLGEREGERERERGRKRGRERLTHHLPLLFQAFYWAEYQCALAKYTVHSGYTTFKSLLKSKENFICHIHGHTQYDMQWNAYTSHKKFSKNLKYGL